MANFVNDYSNLAGAGAAFQSFADSFERAQDSQAKRQEMAARIEAEKSRAQREADQTAIQARVAGLQKNAATGSFDEAPLSPKERSGNLLKAFGEGARPVAFDEQGNPTKYETDTSTPKYKAALNSGIRGQATMERVGNQRDTMAASAVRHVHDDKVIVPMRQQATNIDKGLELMEGNVSYKRLNEIAQDFSSALSGKGVASDFKLKELSTPSLQQKIADLTSYATANPDQPAPPQLVKFWKDMGVSLRDAYDRQMAARANNLLIGQKKAYKNNPNAYEAMAEAAATYRGGAWRNSPDVVGEETSAPAPKGLVGGGGLVKPGLVGTQAPVAPPHPQDNTAVQWARAHPDDPRSAAIIKANGG